MFERSSRIKPGDQSGIERAGVLDCFAKARRQQKACDGKRAAAEHAEKAAKTTKEKETQAEKRSAGGGKSTTTNPTTPVCAESMAQLVISPKEKE